MDDPSPETGGENDPNPETGGETFKPVMGRGPRIVGGRPAAFAQFPYQVLHLLAHQNYR
jgi:hypothetical protein